jgi:bifunctional UDP-N-acetylglucosamine pyrophosphorylase/glucosamine-1-phosphate N-acetyltransferase
MQNPNKLKVVILAAGKGTRMKSDKPKALTEVKGKLMVHHLRETIAKVHPAKPILVIGYQADVVKKELGNAFEYAFQAEQLGTGHAVMAAKKELAGAENIMVFYGDTPFISSTSIEKIISTHMEANADVTFVTTLVPDFDNQYKPLLHFGRIIRNGNRFSTKEYKDASEQERLIKEVNVGCYIFKASWLWENIESIKNENVQKEYYINDLVNIADQTGAKVEAVTINPNEAFAANSKEELEILEKFA